MPRRKQDCPKRMKWEEEALLASARAAAAAAVVDGDSRDLPQADASPRSADEAEVDQELPETSPASLSNEDSARNSPQDSRRPLSDSEETSVVCASPRDRRRFNPGRSSSSPGQQSSSPLPSSSPRSHLLPDMSLLTAAGHGGIGAEQLRAFLAAGVALPGLLSPEGAAELLGFSALSGMSLPNSLLSAMASSGMKLPAAAINCCPPSPNRPLSTRSPLSTPSSGGGPSQRSHGELEETSVLDFSTKARSHGTTHHEHLRNGDSAALSAPRKTGDGGQRTDSPLDLSFTRKRDRPHDLNAAALSPIERKSSRLDPPRSSEVPLWNALAAKRDKNEKNVTLAPPLPPPLLPPPAPAAVNEATRALERMTELTRLTGERSSSLNSLNHSLAGNLAAPAVPPPSALSGRQSAWQSHWLSKGAEAARDVLKCVWCKQSFDSLAAMTTHMKESKHCGVNASLINSAAANSAVSPGSGGSSTAGSSAHSQSLATPSSSPSSHHLHHLQQQHPSLHRSHHLPPTSSPSTSAHHATPTTSSSTSSDILKDAVPMPRKLVRGQDVWLGKGAEQTRQILKCMWCGQSFRSLADMTTHMQQTQHYTNIISQEQIISWKAADDKSTTQNHVNAVLTCKVCDQAFPSLKELSSHMVKNSHYKEHIMRSLSESGGRRRQARDKRKKALPVRKLLELERAQQEARRETQSTSSNSGRITCEKCGDKIETAIFVEHIRACVGSGMSGGSGKTASSQSHKHGSSKETRRTSSSPSAPPRTPDGHLNHHPKLRSNASSPKVSLDHSPVAENNNVLSAQAEGGIPSSSPSVLNAIEKLIEKSFDTPGKRTTSNHLGPGSNILRRLGIDESADYTKPLMDPMTVNMLRLYGYQQRERSASEASSVSDRGGGPADLSHLFLSNGSTAPAELLGRDTETPNSLLAAKDRDGGAKDIESDSRSERLSPGAASDHSDHLIRPSNLKTEAFDDDLPLAHHHPKSHHLRAENAGSPCPSTVSERSMRSATPASLYDRKVNNSSPEEAAAKYSPTRRPSFDLKPEDSASILAGGGSSSLSALSSMFEGLAAPLANTVPSAGANPLAALQKLCDKTDSAHAARSSTSSASSATGHDSGTASATATNPGAILAFSWACNDAVMTDSIMKCAFCDTQFISKGAYRHHLSKMHFVKDPASTQPNHGGKNNNTSGTKSSSQSPQPPSTPNGGSTGSGANFEESPHSKFLKYTELAKQLSSKYV